MTVLCAGWWADAAKTRRVHDEVRVLQAGDGTQPASHGMCPDCRDAFIATLPIPCTCPEHRCVPDRVQRDRYPVAGGYWLCAWCFSMGHAAPLRMQYAGLLP